MTTQGDGARSPLIGSCQDRLHAGGLDGTARQRCRRRSLNRTEGSADGGGLGGGGSDRGCSRHAQAARAQVVVGTHDRVVRGVRHDRGSGDWARHGGGRRRGVNHRDDPQGDQARTEEYAGGRRRQRYPSPSHQSGPLPPGIVPPSAGLVVPARQMRSERTRKFRASATGRSPVPAPPSCVTIRRPRRLRQQPPRPSIPTGSMPPAQIEHTRHDSGGQQSSS